MRFVPKSQIICEFAAFSSAKRSGSGGDSVPECLKDPGNRLLLQEAFAHAADLSNPVKPTAVYQQWVDRVCEEFFAQVTSTVAPVGTWARAGTCSMLRLEEQ